MSVFTIDPLRDRRWTELVNSHAAGSLFHSKAWLQAIKDTYGYKPVAFTTSGPSDSLTNAIVFCEVNSWLTGHRLVSLPFSDHCDPLLDGSASEHEIGAELERVFDSGKWKYIELRPAFGDYDNLEGITRQPASLLHLLDLTRPLDEVLHSTHKTAIQQPIKRAEREGVQEESGSSEKLLTAFYVLLLQTRRRHQLPPQPISWFRNLASNLGSDFQIRVAYKGQKPIASIVTIRHKSTLVYKYAASDAHFNNLGGTPYLLWNAIREAKQAAITCMDFGRSDADNQGLIAFKNRWGAKPAPLVYLRWTKKQGEDVAHSHAGSVVKKVLSVVPDSVLEAAGRVLYRHIG